MTSLTHLPFHWPSLTVGEKKIVLGEKISLPPHSSPTVSVVWRLAGKEETNLISMAVSVSTKFLFQIFICMYYLYLFTSMILFDVILSICEL